MSDSNSITNYFRLLPKEEMYLLDVIGQCADEMGVSAFVIGGYVRDIFLERERKDMDIVCLESGIKLAKKVADKLPNHPKIAIFKNYGTAQIVTRGYEIEFVGARKESYSKNSRNPSVQTGTLKDDQLRRDFTINAMSIALNGKNKGQLLDPFDGLEDLKLKTIKTPRDPVTTFSDDPLRILRAVRFSNQLDFKIEPKTYLGIIENAHRVKILSQERITAEFNKIMSCPKPSIGLKLLYDCGVMDIILPEVSALQGVEIINGVGHKDNFYHTLEVVDNLCRNSDNIWLRWAALLHDIAKPKTKKFDKQLGWTFHGHDAVGAYMVPKIFRRLKLPLHSPMKYVQKLVRLHLRPISLTKDNITDSSIRRLLFDAGEDIEDLMMLCEADITSKNKFKVKKYLENYRMVRDRMRNLEEADKLRNWQPPISGKTIMETFNIAPSKKIGIIKNAIREAILDGKIPNQYEDAYNFMLEQGAELGLTVNK